MIAIAILLICLLILAIPVTIERTVERVEKHQRDLERSKQEKLYASNIFYEAVVFDRFIGGRRTNMMFVDATDGTVKKLNPIDFHDILQVDEIREDKDGRQLTNGFVIRAMRERGDPLETLIFRADGTELTRISQNDDHIIAVIRNSERIGVVLRRD
ncbi:MAG: hypothetical protein AAF568_13820, partial [Pseudomonadota bacterium]